MVPRKRLRAQTHVSCPALCSEQRKPEEESPKQDSEAKKVKQETTVNGSGDSASNGNGVQEKMEQEASF